jgi:hypothetical protein
VSLSNITKSQEEHPGIVVLQAGVEVLNRSLRVLEGLHKTLAIRFGANP